MSDWEGPPPRTGALPVALAIALATVVVAAVALVATRPGADEARLAVDEAPPPPTAPPAPVRRPWRAPAAGHWAGLPPAPLQPRIAQTMVWTGRGLFVWGGFTQGARPLQDGALFDPVAGAWRALPPTSVPTTIQPAVVVAGRVLVMSPTAAAAYDVERDRWIDLPPPPLPEGTVLTDQVVTGGDAAVVLAVDRGTARPRLLALHPDLGWRDLPVPPVRVAPGDTLLGSSRRLMLLTRATPDGPVVVHELARGARRWRRIATPPGLDAAPVGRLTGTARAWRTIVLGIPPDGGVPYVARYAQRRWQRLPPPPIEARGEIDVLEAGPDIVLWDHAQGGGVRFDEDLDRWVALPRSPTPRAVAHPVVWTGDGIATWGGFTSGGAVYRLPRDGPSGPPPSPFIME